ncbi:MAG: two-component regulator propeller domain-containing protein, partial [Rhodothermales bacterium]
SLWIGTDGGGLHRLRDGKFTTYTTKEGLANDFVYTVYEDLSGTIWIGTEEGVTRLEKGILTSFTTQDGLSDNFVLSIYGTRDGSLWLGTNGGGLNRWKGGRFSTYTTEDGLPHNTVWALYEDAEGTLWISTLAGVTRFRDGQFSPFTTDDGLSSDEITAFTEDPTGTLWMGTYTGELNRVKDGRVLETYTAKDGLANNAVLDLHADAQGTLWFSTLEGGLHRLRDGQLTSFTTHDGLFNDTIYRILEDRRGNLWLTSSQGLFVLSKQQLDAYAQNDRAVLTPTVYDQSDGLKSREFMGGPQPAGWRSRDGKLWLPTVKGTAMIDPAHLRHNAHPPQVLIERAAANNETIPLTDTASLQAGQDKFEFHYVGLSLLVPEKVRYRYMLEGVDETWVDAGPRREAYYTNLKPGAYTFKVIASNNDGVWSEQEATVSFYLRPYFHQTPLFYALCALGLLLATFIIYRLRVRRLKQREKELIQLVEARTRDLRQEKERTELALQETEKARREAEQQKDIAENAKAVIEEQAVKLQEMSIIKTRFFNNISHEFRTPLTLNIGPLENALMGAYGPVNDDLKKQLEVMLRNSRLLLRLINQLLDVAKLESGNMGLHMRRGNLAELLEGVVLSFTAFAERKSITLDFSAEHDPLSFNFDPSHLEKVFFNLLSNAVKFTPEQGRVTVSTYEGAPGANGIEGETVIIRFKDTGPGIPAEDASYIFDRFHQVDGTISKVQEG